MDAREHPGEEVYQWVELLRSKMKTALSSDRGATRGIRTRGVPVVAVVSEVSADLPVTETGDPLQPVLERLREEPPEVRREVIAVLGEQGDELAIEVLERLVKWEPQWRLRSVVVAALSRAGRPQAIDILMDIARNDLSEEVRAEAIRQLGERALVAWPILAERTRSAPRVRGAIRTRGVTPSKSVGLSPEAEAILSLLDRTRFRDPSRLVRGVADETLGRLDE